MIVLAAAPQKQNKVFLIAVGTIPAILALSSSAPNSPLLAISGAGAGFEY
jgi:hypothetical protein